MSFPTGSGAAEALAAIPEIIAAVVLTIVSIRQARPRRPASIALAIGLCTGSALTLLIESALDLR